MCTCFYQTKRVCMAIFVPLLSREGGASCPHTTDTPVTLPGALIVDADDGIRDAVRFLLEDAGYRVSEAKTGREALIYILSNPDASVILIDVSRPRPEDMLLLEWIFGGEPPTARHAFVLLSTNPARALGPALELAIVCGVPVVAKPFDIDDLLDAVASAARRIAGGVLFDEVPASTRHTDPPLGPMTARSLISAESVGSASLACGTPRTRPSGAPS